MGALSEPFLGEVDRQTRELVERRRDTSKARSRGWLVRRALVAADVLGLAFAFLIVEWIFVHRGAGVDRVAEAYEYAGFFMSLPAWIVAAKLYNLYDRDEERTDHTTVEDLVDVFHLVTVGVWLLYGISALSNVAQPTFLKLFAFWGLGISLVTLFRVIARTLCRRHILYLQNTLVIGAGVVGQLIARKLLLHSEYGLNLVALVDETPLVQDEALKARNIAVFNDMARIKSVVDELHIERVIIASPNRDDEDTDALVRELADHNVQVDIVPHLFNSVTRNAIIHTIEGIPVIGLPPLRLSRSSRLVKRGIDVGGSLAVLIVLSPVFLVVALLVKMSSRGPVFYRHERVGRGGQKIEVLKFRTMRREFCRGERYGGQMAEDMFQELLAEPQIRREFEETYKLSEDPRVTPVGRILRRTSLDELPQLLNVILGDLSLVGPRAVTRDELARYGGARDVLLSARPGVTGYWQINGRSRLDYSDRVRLDLAYLSGWSLGLDLVILGKTLRVIFSRSGAV